MVGTQLTAATHIELVLWDLICPRGIAVSPASQEVRVDVIDVMTFDKDAKISSLRAYFGPSNIVAFK